MAAGTLLSENTGIFSAGASVGCARGEKMGETAFIAHLVDGSMRDLVSFLTPLLLEAAAP